MKSTAYLLQATLISIWWIGLFTYPDFYAAFQFPEIGKTAFNSFLLPDLTIIVILSIIRAYIKREEFSYIILGGFAFAALYCINATILTKGGFLSTTVMILGLCYNLFLVFDKRLFRQSNTDSVFINGIKTMFQIVCVWAITLVVFPLLILKSFNEPIVVLSDTKFIAIFLFIIFSFIGLYSAYVIVKNGSGTPLPLDQTQQLVVSGPYKYVRNPMAVAGIGQGVAVSLLLGSIYILIYTLFGALLWQLVVRPIEERNMSYRFGTEYDTYRKEVKCWIPKL